MRGTLAALMFAFAAMPPGGSSDVTLRTRSHFGDHGAVELMTLQMSGARRLIARQTQMPDGLVITAITNIVQCDLGRALILNDRAKIYAIEPAAPPSTRAAVAMRPATVDIRPVVETRTIDAVDTGERRAFGPLMGRHVVTTTTVERAGKAAEVAGVRDGWYVDVDSRGCDGDDTGYAAVLIGSVGSGRVDVKWRGTARTGLALIERDRTMTAAQTIERTTELIDVSQAPIPSSTFDVPAGYRRALALPGGGADLTQPDSIANRVAAYWRYAAGWIASFWW
jgi:hypothetical protein